jgi:uncharacterized protein
MLVYQANKTAFLRDVADHNIEDIVLDLVRTKLKMNVGEAEVRSWHNSLGEMFHILNDEGIPGDAGIAIEYRIPQTSKRIDFIISGEDEDRREQVVLIELKQWDEALLTEKDGIVVTRYQGGLAETYHPSYQVWSYAQLMNGYNATVYEEGISLQPCAYLHNYVDDGVLSHPFYKPYIVDAPLFLKGDKEKLRGFISKYIKHGERKETMFRIDHGRIRPSKSLTESLSSMLKGNKEFIMIDEQKLVFESALKIGREAGPESKKVLIVRGGPGTGKSVVAINLLVAFTEAGKVVHYSTKNAAPRTVFESMLTGHFKKSVISNMFKGSGSYIDAEPNTFGAIVVDEAQRLSEKSGMFKNLGENQIKEIINAAEFSVFFIDEDQTVTWADIGDVDAIKGWAKKFGAEVVEMELGSQFRCNGSDGYIAWLDYVLGIRSTANDTFDERDFNIKVFDSPSAMRDEIFAENEIRNKARLVAGYCWDWKSKKNRNAMDIEFPEYNFSMKWNLASYGNLWITNPESVTEVGCIHTCQGLELDYVGVIVGNDLIVRDGKVLTNPEARAKTDQSLKGYKKLHLFDHAAADNKADRIIKNTYRTLMTRGMKGCYLYFTDKETAEYFKMRLGAI